MSSTPVSNGMALCDYFLVEGDTNKESLIGNFTTLRLPRLPGVAPGFWVYSLLTGGRGEVTIDLNLMRLDTGAEVTVDRAVLSFPDKLAEVKFFTRLRKLYFPTEGHYQFTILADGQWVAQRRLFVTTAEDGNERTES